MPVQTIKASGAYAAGHIKDNLWLWIGALVVLTAVLTFLQLNSMTRNVWGDLASFSGMVLGILVMVKSQEGFVSTHVAPDDEADVLPSAGPLQSKPL